VFLEGEMAMSELVTTGHDVLIILGKLGAAFLFGALIGFERQIRQRNAGLRTMVLVAVGAAAFVHLGSRLLGGEGEVRIIAYVVSGIGFLGAGVIMKEGAHVHGLNTAATLWSSAAVGAFCGSGLIAEAAVVTLLVLAGNTMLRPVVDFINRQPLNPGTTEAVYQVHVVCAAEAVTDARDLLADRRAHRNRRQRGTGGDADPDNCGGGGVGRGLRRPVRLARGRGGDLERQRDPLTRSVRAAWVQSG
jgi:putative Mg2+ transporter-C (MgtC) family protein